MRRTAERIDVALRDRRHLDAATVAHLEDCAARIRRALDATLIQLPGLGK